MGRIIIPVYDIGGSADRRVGGALQITTPSSARPDPLLPGDRPNVRQAYGPGSTWYAWRPGSTCVDRVIATALERDSSP